MQLLFVLILLACSTGCTHIVVIGTDNTITYTQGSRSKSPEIGVDRQENTDDTSR